MKASRRMFVAGSVPAMLGVAAGARVAAEPAGEPLQSFAKSFASMTVQDHGASTFRAICDGMTAAGARVEVHETELKPGAEPHPPHRHKHEEFLLIVKGQVEVTIDGQTSVLGPGSVGFWKTMSLHHARNVGQDTAQYFIVSVGADT